MLEMPFQLELKGEFMLGKKNSLTANEEIAQQFYLLCDPIVLQFNDWLVFANSSGNFSQFDEHHQNLHKCAAFYDENSISIGFSRYHSNSKYELARKESRLRMTLHRFHEAHQDAQRIMGQLILEQGFPSAKFEYEMICFLISDLQEWKLGGRVKFSFTESISNEEWNALVELYKNNEFTLAQWKRIRTLQREKVMEFNESNKNLAFKYDYTFPNN